MYYRGVQLYANTDNSFSVCDIISYSWEIYNIFTGFYDNF